MAKASVNGTTIAQSEQTEQVEGNAYFPRASVAMTLLEESETEYTCPWKGKAQYYHIDVGAERIKDAAWSYPDPKDAARHIAGHLAFDKTKVSVS